MEIITIIFALLSLAAGGLILKLWSANQDLESKLHWTYLDMLRTATANANHAAAEKDGKQTQEIKALKAEIARRDKIDEKDSYGNLVSQCINLRLDKQNMGEVIENLREHLRKLSKAKTVVRVEEKTVTVTQADPVTAAENVKLSKRVETLEREAIHHNAEKEEAATIANERANEIQSLQRQIKTLRMNQETERTRIQHKTGTDESETAKQLQTEKYEHSQTKERLMHSQNERMTLSRDLSISMACALLCYDTVYLRGLQRALASTVSA